jgi:hypothetical protein
MQRCTLTIARWTFCALLGWCLVVPAAGAADKPAEKPSTPPASTPSMEAQMAAWAKLAEPGPNHEFFKSMAGTWKAVTKSLMGPGEPQTSEGTAVYTVKLGGRFVTEEFRGTFDGKPFEGFGVFGYDNQHQEFVSTWVDSMGTGILMSKGKLDPSGKVLTMLSEYEDPMSGQKKMMRMVTTIVDPNRHVFAMYDGHGENETKMMEITYTRK